MSARRTGFARLGLALLVLFGLLSAGVLTSSAYHALATRRDLNKFPPPGQMIDAGGYRLHIYCVGEGEPTVVLEAGMSGWSVDWALVQPEVARETRVCAYDRAGYGWSDEGPEPQDSQQVTAALHALLSGAGIDGEIILVGHSLGGLFVQHYARLYPQQVAGVVLVDSVHPRQSELMPEHVREKYEGNLKTLTSLTRVIAPTGLLRLAGLPATSIVDKLPAGSRDAARALGYQSKAYRAMDAEMASFQQSQAQVRQAGQLPGHIPLAVISARGVEGYPPGFSDGAIKTSWDEMQADLSLSASIPQVIAANSGHYIHLDEPELVTRAILDIVEMARQDPAP